LRIVLAGALFGWFVLGIASPVWAQVVATCGASKGYSYFLPGPLTSADQAGWEEDGISNGGLQLLQDGDNFDIVYTDAVGSRSAKADGATVFGYQAAAGILVLLVYPDVLETYQFNLESKQLAWTQNKAFATIRKVAAFTSNCQ
jgi:hypothetical protein